MTHHQPRELGNDRIIAVLELLALLPGRLGNGKLVTVLFRVKGVQTLLHALHPEHRLGVFWILGLGLDLCLCSLTQPSCWRWL